MGRVGFLRGRLKDLEHKADRGSMGVEFILWVFMFLCFILLPLVMIFIEYQDFTLKRLESSQYCGAMLEEVPLNSLSESLAQKKVQFVASELRRKMLEKTQIKTAGTAATVLEVSCEVLERTQSQNKWDQVIVRWRFRKAPLTQIGVFLAKETSLLDYELEARVECPVDGLYE